MYEGIQLDIFIRQLKALVESAVFKKQKDADAYETLDIQREAERYIMVKDGTDDFTSYVNFEYDVYKAAGIPQALIVEYQNDKNAIPYGLRDSIVKLEEQYILANYVEKNNYYRMLSGVPDVDDMDFIYVPSNDYGISTVIPVHQLDSNQLAILASSGIKAQLITKYPDKKYLRYLGDSSISVYKARRANNYELLYCEITEPDNISGDFKKFYSNAREYYMNAVYNPGLANMYAYYDRFIGFCILVMGIQRLFASIFKQGITRDFYDTQLLRYLFESYSIPYIEEMTIDQMKILAKNLNIFLSYKSSTKVLFDICSIFGFSNVNIYKYLLIKDHVHGNDGTPVFLTKTVSNGDGSFTTVPDYAQMYKLYFQKVNVKSKDVNAALEDQTNRVDYAAMISSDMYWFDDADLRQKIYEAEFNKINTKYLSLDIMFRLTEMMYEICHVFRMIQDNRKEFAKVSLYIPKVSFKPKDLFSVVIFLCAMFCKRYGFGGEIPLKPESIAYVYGFNFSADIPKLVEDILSRNGQSKYIDTTVVKYLLNFTVNSSKDVARIYKNIKGLKDFVVEQMAETTDLEVYRAYKSLYNSVLVVQDKASIYSKSDGTYASTYMDLLKDIDSQLYAYVSAYDPTDHKTYVAVMQHVLYKMEDLSSDFKYLHTAVDSEALFGVLEKLIKFLKSYTVDLSSVGVLYIFDDKYFNMLKVLDKIHSIEVKMDLRDRTDVLYMDLVDTMEVTIPEEDLVKLKEDLFAMVKWYMTDQINVKDDCTIITERDVRDKLMTMFADDFDMSLISSVEDKVVFFDKITHTIINALEDVKIQLKDDITKIVAGVDNSSRLLLKSICEIDAKVDTESELNMKDLSKLKSVFFFDEHNIITKVTCDILAKDEYRTDAKITDYCYPEIFDVNPQSQIFMKDDLAKISVTTE